MCSNVYQQKSNFNQVSNQVITNYLHLDCKFLHPNACLRLINEEHIKNSVNIGGVK